MRLGFKGKLYRNTATYANPTWDEIANARDVTLTMEADEAEATRRVDGGFRTVLQGLEDLTVEAEMPFDYSDLDFKAIFDVHAARGSIEVLVLDGPVAPLAGETTAGVRLTATVTRIQEAQPLGEVSMASITFKPAPAANPPSFVSFTGV